MPWWARRDLVAAGVVVARVDFDEPRGQPVELLLTDAAVRVATGVHGIETDEPEHRLVLDVVDDLLRTGPVGLRESVADRRARGVEELFDVLVPPDVAAVGVRRDEMGGQVRGAEAGERIAQVQPRRRPVELERTGGHGGQRGVARCVPLHQAVVVAERLVLELLVVRVVPGGDDELERLARGRAHTDPADGPDHRLLDLERQRLVGTERGVEGERAALLFGIAVEELDPARRLGVHEVAVREVDERHRAVDRGVRRRVQVGAREVRLARPERQTIVRTQRAVGELRTLHDGLVQRGQPAGRRGQIRRPGPWHAGERRCGGATGELQEVATGQARRGGTDLTPFTSERYGRPLLFPGSGDDREPPARARGRRRPWQGRSGPARWRSAW